MFQCLGSPRTRREYITSWACNLFSFVISGYMFSRFENRITNIWLTQQKTLWSLDGIITAANRIYNIFVDSHVLMFSRNGVLAYYMKAFVLSKWQDLAVVVLLILIPLISPNSSKGGVRITFSLCFYTVSFSPEI